MKVIQTFNAQPVKIPHFKSLLTRKQAGDPIFLFHFYNVDIMNVHYAKFQKKFDSRTISRELPSVNILFMTTGGCPTEKQFDVTRKKQSRSSIFRWSQLARPKQLNATQKKYSRSLIFRLAHPWNCRVSHLKQFDVNAKALIFNHAA